MPEATKPREQPHRNHGLFSDHYLNVTLPQRPEWQALTEQARPVMAGISRVFDSYTPSDNEAQTEEDLVRPVLRLLGHDFEVQPALETPDGTKRPDYVFYHDLASLTANKNRTLDDESLRGAAFAVGDAKYWDRRLDVSLRGRGDPFTNKKAQKYKTHRSPGSRLRPALLRAG
jgi:hypothetical protein